jgi:hypothetical protein
MSKNMKQRFRIYRRKAGVYYIVESATGKRESLNTKSLQEATRLLHARNEAIANPTITLQIARAYLAVADPEVKKRTWRNVIEEVAKLKHGENQLRWERASNDPAFELIHDIVVMETRPECRTTIIIHHR